MANYRSLKELVYDHISGEIASGKLRPAEGISESEICAALGISRTPVREALMQLSNEGYIEHIPRRGFFTRELNLQKVRNIFEIIGNLESLAAVKCVEDPDRLDLEAMRRLAKGMDEAIAKQHRETYHRLQYQFHDILNRACDNEDLVRLVVNLKKFFMREEYLSQSIDGNTQHNLSQMNEEDWHILAKLNEEHWHILALIEAGDGEALRIFIRDVHWNVKYAAFHQFV